MDFLPNALSVLYLLLFLLVGCLLAAACTAPGGKTAAHDFTLILPLGCCFGLLLLEVLPALFALAVGFNAFCAALAAAAAALLGAAVIFLQAPRQVPRLAPWQVPRPIPARQSKENCSPLAAPAEPLSPCGKRADSRVFSKTPAPRSVALPFWLCVLPLLGFTCYLIGTHILHAENGALWTGQSCYGDLPMHLAFIKSIAVQGIFPPEYPLLAGQNLFGYPFLCESVSSVFLVLGAGLRTAAILPMLPAFFAVYGMFFQLAARVLGSAKRAALAFWLFFFGSGFGFLYFCGSVSDFKRIFTGFYTTPTNFLEHNIRWVNPVVDLLLPQRATLFGWAALFGCLYLLYRFAFEGERRLWLPLGILAGSLPLVHTHSFLALALISAVWFLRAVFMAAGAARNRKSRPAGAAETARTQTPPQAAPAAVSALRSPARALWPWLAFAALTAALACPQLFGVILRQTGSGQNFLRFALNWVNEDDNYFWFYIKNIGVVYLLLLPAFLFAKKELRWFYGGGLLILAVAETVAFQPNLYDNNKLLFIWHALGCILAAGFLCDLPARLRSKRLCGVLLAAALFLGTFGSVLTLGREAVSRYRQFSAEDISLAEFVEQNTAAGALFCTGMQHLNPICSLAGRDILCGSTSYVYFHGMNYTAQENAVRALYETPSETLLAEWGVDYLLISSWERGSYAVDEAFYAARYPAVYADGENTLYQISTDR